MPKKIKTSPFYCYKKNTRKSAHDTPEYLNMDDWEIVKALLNCKSADDFYKIVHESEETMDAFYYRIIGWPEGRYYMRSETFRNITGWPGILKHDIPKLLSAFDLNCKNANNPTT